MNTNMTIDDVVPKVQKEIDKLLENRNYEGWSIRLPHGICFEFLNRFIEEADSIDENIVDAFVSSYVNEDGNFSIIKTIILEKIKENLPGKYREKIEKLKDDEGYLTIYRGEGEKSFKNGYSWSLNPAIAYNFACFYEGEEARVITGKIKKKDVILYIDEERHEEEILVLPKDVRIISEEVQYGTSAINEAIDGTDYFKILVEDYIPYAQDLYGEKSYHDRKHAIRVMLNAAVLAKLRNIDLDIFRDILTAALYHDAGRIDDDIDEEHGEASVEIMKEDDIFKFNEGIEMAIKYHCLGDEAFHKALEKVNISKEEKDRISIIYNVVCDADSLDRVRYGINELDVRYLRLPESKKLVLFAFSSLRNIK